MKHLHRFPAQSKFTEELRRTDGSPHPPGGDGGLRVADAGRPRASLRSDPAFAGRKQRPGRLPRRTCGSAPPPASPGSGAAAAPAEMPPSQKAASSALPWRRDGSCPRAIRGGLSFPRLSAPGACEVPREGLAPQFSNSSRGRDATSRDFSPRLCPRAET